MQVNRTDDSAEFLRHVLKVKKSESIELLIEEYKRQDEYFRLIHEKLLAMKNS